MTKFTFWLVSLAFLAMACTPIQPVPTNSDSAVTAPNEQTQPSETVEVNDITLAYESFGDPAHETILLVAGTGMHLVDWPLELVNELVQRGYRVVRSDNRDIGLSTKLSEAGMPDSAAIGKALEKGEPPPLPYTLQTMADDAVGLLDALAIEEAHLVGISMGGAIAQLVAIDYPERTRSLTLLAADSGNPDLPALANPAAFANVPPQPMTVDKEPFLTWQVKVWQALAGADYPTDETTLQAWAERNFARNFDPAALVRQQTVSFVGHLESARYRLNNLENIRAPTVIVQGDADPIVPVASAEDLAARIPEADLRIIPGLGHDIPPALISTFVDAITAAARRAG